MAEYKQVTVLFADVVHSMDIAAAVVGPGRSRDSIVYDLSHGEGLMPSSYNAPIIYDAATKYLC